MAKKENQKLKLLYIQKCFNECTDEEHGLTIAEIAKKLESYGITAERKTLYDDIEELKKFGMDIKDEKIGRNVYYRLVSRTFEMPELKLLVDSVLSAKFITETKSAELIEKLEGLTSVHEAKQLQRQVLIAGRVKAMNENIYYNVDKIHEAIAGNFQIAFQYFQWNERDVVGPTPDVVGAWMESQGFIYQDQGTVHEGVVPTLRHFGCDGEMLTPGMINGVMSSSYFQEIYNYVASGYCAILLMGGTQTNAGGACRTDYWSYRGHYICICGARDGQLLANDPYYAPRDGWHSITDYSGRYVDSYNGNVKKIWKTKARWKSDDTTYSFTLPQSAANSSGKYVKLWQRLMKGIGYYTGAIDGSFGKLTQEATVKYQNNKGLVVDIVVGPKTWSKAIPVAFTVNDSLITFTAKQIEYRYQGVEAYLWQNLMKGWGYYTGSVDTSFGDGCKKVTVAFQKDHGMAGDGYVGPNSWSRAIGV